MEDYNFWADLLASYRASPDFAKLLVLLVPLVLSLGFAALAVGMALRLIEPRQPRRAASETTGEEAILLDAPERASQPLLPAPQPLRREG